MNIPENFERIDDWASRLIDDDIVLDDVDSTSRDAVTERAEQLRVMRDALRRTRDDTSTITDDIVAQVLVTSSRHRRVVPYVAGLAAAAAVVAVVGVAVSSTGDPREPSIVADATTQTKVAAVESATATEAPPAGQATTAMDVSAGDACPDAVRPTIIPLAFIDDEAVEIHWSAVDGVVVYRISDCSVVLATTP